MIYLIEENASRRYDYGWTDEKVSEYKDVLYIVDNANSFIELMPSMQKDGNVILYHESFIRKENFETRNSINSFIKTFEETQTYNIAYFSGSKNRRTLDSNVCSMPAAALYVNLESFVKHYKDKGGQIDFKYLMFGDNPEIEVVLLKKIKEVNNDLKNLNPEKIFTQRRIIVFRTFENSIQFPVTNAIIKNGCDLACEDEDLIALVSEQRDIQYDAIYIPLSMGETLSDFLGLRLAMFFRLIDTANKYAHIFIYGDADFSLFINSECAEIFKMPGVSYVSANATSLKDTLYSIHRISEDDYRMGLKKIHLSVPSDIGDNHSVANIWGLYRWSLALGHTDLNLLKKTSKVGSTLYFFYLNALYPPSALSCINKNKLHINNEKKQESELNVLYVDDEADEGWDELLYHIFYNINGIENFDSIGNEIKSKSQTEIVDIVKNKVDDMDANLVILDLRLHPDDFSAPNINEITGYKILEMLKHKNRGIQVLMFSATNKIWNLQALLEQEADGFIMKEGPENSVDPTFTEKSITEFIALLSHCSRLTVRKSLWPSIQRVKSRLKFLLREDNENKKLLNTIFTLIMMAEDALFDGNQKHSLDSTFINLFTAIEFAANEWIEMKKGQYGYNFYFKDNGDPLYFFEEGNSQPGKEWKYADKRLPYFIKISNTLYHVGAYDSNIQKLVDKRNAFTHPKHKLTYFSVKDILDIFTVVEKIIYKLDED